MNREQWRIRPKAFIIQLAIGIPIAIVLTFIGTYLYQETRLWLANGEWCVRFHPDGRKKVLYGDECRK